MPSSSASPYPTREDSAGTSLVVRHPKRRGVALSCAECRRLKLKCSRDFPCSNCVKKGCAAICPEGSLTTGKGNRFVLANTEVLHDKITILANRVRQLEDGLAVAHSQTSHTPHPLLSEELLQIKRPLERERMDAKEEEKPETEDNIDSLGSLSISTDGRSTFFGRTASSWHLLQIEEGSDEDDDSSDHLLESTDPSDAAWLSHAFPFASPTRETAQSVREIIMSKLPRMSNAKVLCECYFQHAAWMYTPITEEDFYKSIFKPLYEPDANYEQVGGQNLSILCNILAIGALLDLSKPAHSPEAMQYYHYARASLSIESVLEEPSISAIQAMLLMCHFMFLSEISGPRWAIMGMVVKLAQSIGLHRDSRKWNLDPAQTKRRRELFYELLTYDSWQSLTFGRPPSLSSAHIDNQLPHEATQNAAGELEMSFAAWKHRFSAQCLSVVHDEAFGAKPTTYKAIQELDRKVRNWYVPPSLQVPGFGAAKLVSAEVEQPTVQLTMQRYTAYAIKEMSKTVLSVVHNLFSYLLLALFYMHRGFFAQALEDNPIDPMGSKYSPSVLAAYGSATSFVGLIESLFNQHPQLTERMWFLLTHVFSCAIVLGSIAAKSQMALARSALSHLDSAYNLFTRVSDHSKAGKIIPILAKLREKAHMANTNLTLHPESRSSLYGGSKIKSEVDELSALGGMTRLVSRRSSSSPSVAASSPSSQHSSPPSTVADSQSQILLSHPESSSPAPNAWQNYTHIQNFNVNINMGDYYPSSLPITPDPSQGDMYVYQMPQHIQQQHQQSHMSIDMSAEQSYFAGGYTGTGYGNGRYMMTPSDLTTPGPHDLQETWQNFVAQYK
ncbi:fungal-specific transcription factor domain-containing protein [Gymnopilus junonius]|uniref:Fungal-specific transcription factor domain-containing protein n=1 Tax=Gymnopilus junonius TaxID=109634 RepID=A0A9P5NLY0_GYMJU|nr:fungal-specific transcription factor domain-containing protein [Gymnopilus junonius]